MSDYTPPAGAGGGNVTAASAVTLASLPTGALFNGDGEMTTLMNDASIEPFYFGDSYGFGFFYDGGQAPVLCGRLEVETSITTGQLTCSELYIGEIVPIADGTYPLGSYEITTANGLITAINPVA